MDVTVGDFDHLLACEVVLARTGAILLVSSRHLHNDGVHASYRARLKVQTIDRWPAREALDARGTASALPQGFAIIAVPHHLVHSSQLQLRIQLQLLHTWIRFA